MAGVEATIAPTGGGEKGFSWENILSQLSWHAFRTRPRKTISTPPLVPAEIESRRAYRAGSAACIGVTTHHSKIPGLLLRHTNARPVHKHTLTFFARAR